MPKIFTPEPKIEQNWNHKKKKTHKKSVTPGLVIVFMEAPFEDANQAC